MVLIVRNVTMYLPKSVKKDITIQLLVAIKCHNFINNSGFYVSVHRSGNGSLTSKKHASILFSKLKVDARKCSVIKMYWFLQMQIASLRDAC